MSAPYAGGSLHELRAIQDRDPSGWAHREPTAEDYRAFEAWAVAGYGRATYTRYLIGGWAPVADW